MLYDMHVLHFKSVIKRNQNVRIFFTFYLMSCGLYIKILKTSEKTVILNFINTTIFADFTSEKEKKAF